jgi:hypothetical protein
VWEGEGEREIYREQRERERGGGKENAIEMKMQEICGDNPYNYIVFLCYLHRHCW